jgi:hypothetical protein
MLKDANVAHSVQLRHGKFHGGVDFFHATVGEMLDLTGSELDEYFNLEGASIGSNLLLSDSAVFRRGVYALFMSVGGVLQANGSRFEGDVELGGAEIKHNLLLRWSARFGVVNLSNARIGDTLDLSGATFEHVFASNTQARDLFISGTSIRNQIILDGATVERALQLPRCDAHDHVGWCGPENRLWNDWGYMSLRSARVGSIEDAPEPVNWPRLLSLDGFTYDHLGTFGGGRETGWYVQWLGRDPDVSPQPYQQLAKAYRDIGAYRQANDVLYALRERVRAEARFPRSFGLGLL